MLLGSARQECGCACAGCVKNKLKKKKTKISSGPSPSLGPDFDFKLKYFAKLRFKIWPDLVKLIKWRDWVYHFKKSGLGPSSWSVSDLGQLWPHYNQF